MAEFGLVKSFHIDNGELDGQSPQQCFVLGYELGVIDTLLKLPAPFDMPVHAENQGRISEECRKACEDGFRNFKLEWMEGDSSESWMRLMVGRRPNKDYSQ